MENPRVLQIYSYRLLGSWGDNAPEKLRVAAVLFGHEVELQAMPRSFSPQRGSVCLERVSIEHETVGGDVACLVKAGGSRDKCRIAFPSSSQVHRQAPPPGRHVYPAKLCKERRSHTPHKSPLCAL